MKGKGAGRAMVVAGTMSGTSLDGLDLAVIETDGTALLGLGETRYRAFAPAERETLRAALGTWPGDPRAEAAARVIEAAHVSILDGLGPVEAVGVHGQTLAHDPGAGRTHQAGDGARIAAATGRQVLWDFRSNDVGMGGQGAPLAPFFHWAALRWAGIVVPAAVLNLGGVGNLTWLDPAAPAPEAPGACLAFDTGPANAPIDDLCRARGLGAQDAGGALALAGRADAGLVEEVLAQTAYFAAPPPKSLDRDAFAGLQAAVAPLSDADAAATLAAVAVGAVARGVAQLPAPPARLFVTGGGRHNRALMAGLLAALEMPVDPVEVLGLDGDALEAQAFAYLAARVLLGLPTSAPGTTGVIAPVGGARRARP